MISFRTPLRRFARRAGALAFFSLATLPLLVAAARTPRPVRFAVIGDSGTGDRTQFEVARQMAEWHNRLPYGLTLMLGDNIYGDLLRRKGGDKRNFESKFDKPYFELLACGVIFRAALGKHDLEERNGRDLIESRDRFHIDSPKGYYSFTAGESSPGIPLLEFFVLNTTPMAESRTDPEQLAWLGRALEASRARWLIVYGHHPLYSTGRAHGGEVGLREKLEPLLLQPAKRASASGKGPRVRVVLAGHDHIYERLRPQKGVVYFVCGSSGQLRPGDAALTADVAAVEDRPRVFMLWEATPDALRFRAINARGEAFDCGEIPLAGSVKNLPCSAPKKSR